MDLVEILVRYPIPPTKGPGILTASGAYVGLTNDFAEEIGLDLPELEPATLKKVSEVLPAYGNYGNPLDVTAGFSPDSLPVAVKALIDDPNVGMLFISFPISYRRGGEGLQQGHGGLAQAQGHGGARRHLAARPRCHAGGRAKVRRCSRARRTACCARSRSIPATDARSPAPASPPTPRRFRACPSSARARSRSGWARRSWRRPASACPTASLPARPTTPSRSPGASAIRWRLKAQAAALSHKTEAGGVMLNLADEAALRAAWATMQQNVKRAAPGVTLDGCLVERMSREGPRADDRRQARSGLGHGAAARARRHLGRGAGRRAAAAGRRRRDADRRGAAQAAHGEAARRLPRRAARGRRSGGEGRARASAG